MSREKDKFILRWAKRYRAVQELGGKCNHCSEDDIFVLQFHHIDPTQKDFGISQFSAHGEWTDLKKELDKCILLCGSCHSKLHLAETEKKFNTRIDEIKAKASELDTITKFRLDEDYIYEMLKKKYSLNFIAKSLSKDVSSIYDVALRLENRFGEKLIQSKSDYNNTIQKITNDELIKLLAEDKKAKDIALQYNMSPSTVFERIKKIKIKFGQVK